MPSSAVGQALEQTAFERGFISALLVLVSIYQGAG